MSNEEIFSICKSPALPVRRIQTRLGYHSLKKHLVERLKNFEESYFFSNQSNPQLDSKSIVLIFRKSVKMANGTLYTGHFDSKSNLREGFGI